MTESTVARAPTPTVKPKRNAKGHWLPGYSGHPGGDAARARKALNAATITEMHRAFREGGREAIDKVMKTQPAVFLKLLVLLVPRELEVTRSGGVKSMSDEQIEAAIEVITDMGKARSWRDCQGGGRSRRSAWGNSDISDTPENPQEAVRWFPPASRRGARRGWWVNLSVTVPLHSAGDATHHGQGAPPRPEPARANAAIATMRCL
jgi:hypothetical protein